MAAARSDIDLVALICSKLCHDLAGSIGAVSNGAELLAEETDAAMREEAIRLIAQSAGDAAKRLAFFRLALGASGGMDEPMAMADVSRVTTEYFNGGRVRLLPLTGLPNSLPKPLAKALMLGLAVMAMALPRGGALRLGLQNGEWRVQAEGSPSKLPDDVAMSLLGDGAVEEPAGALARHAADLAATAGYALGLEAGAEGAALRFFAKA
ncbi:histidine phosphotransferase family protein [Ferrovibrio sp.]|uniref:histidine phosphotransferase family protein n=1 Tax=Ferrovibrio sp. TaxID=1917215 RepID=UPI003D0C192F